MSHSNAALLAEIVFERLSQRQRNEQAYQKLEALMIAGADPAWTNSQHSEYKTTHEKVTLAMQAASALDARALKILHAFGCPMDTADTKDKTPLSYALSYTDEHNKNILKLVEETALFLINEARVAISQQDIMNAAASGHVAVLEAMNKAGANLNGVSDTFGEVPLVAAISRKQPRAVKALVEMGADLTSWRSQKSGKSLLEFARDIAGLSPDSGEAAETVSIIQKALGMAAVQPKKDGPKPA